MLTCIIVGIASLLAALIAVSKAFGFHAPARVDYDAIQWPVGRSGLYTPHVTPAEDAFPLQYCSPYVSTPPQGGSVIASRYPTVFEYEASQQLIHYDYDEPMSSYPEENV